MFDESHGLRRVEELLDRGEDESEQASRAVNGNTDSRSETRRSEHSTQAATEEFGNLRRGGYSHSNLDYKAECEVQRDNTQRLTDRIEQLEKQLSHRTLELHSEQSQLQLRIQPGKVKPGFRKTGSGVA